MEKASKRPCCAVTITGVDAWTDCCQLPLGIEWGFLYSETGNGRPRYPSRRLIASSLSLFPRYRSSLHVCGSKARDRLLEYGMPDLTHNVTRIQVNGRVAMTELIRICETYSDHEIITQHTDANRGLLDYDGPNHSVLVDGSGGRGIVPESWPKLDTNKRVGFAGGIGPYNVAEQLDKIQQVAPPEYWIDMESKVRDGNDRLDLELVSQVIEAVQESYDIKPLEKRHES